MTVTIAQVGMGGIGSAVDRRLARLRPAEREAPASVASWSWSMATTTNHSE